MIFRMVLISGIGVKENSESSSNTSATATFRFFIPPAYSKPTETNC